MSARAMAPSRRLLEGLVQQLMHHQSTLHGDDDAQEEFHSECRSILSRFRATLPALTRYLDPKSKDVDHVGQVVQVLQLLLEGVCPHSVAVFDFGRGHQVTPVVRALLPLLPPPHLSPVQPRVVEVISTLALMLSAHLVSAFECLFRELVQLLRSLEVLKAAWVVQRTSAAAEPADLSAARIHCLDEFISIGKDAAGATKSSFPQEFFTSDLELPLPTEAHCDNARHQVLLVVADLLKHPRIQFLRYSTGLLQLCDVCSAHVRSEQPLVGNCLTALWSALRVHGGTRATVLDDAMAMCLRKLVTCVSQDTDATASPHSSAMLSMCTSPLLNCYVMNMQCSTSVLLKTTLSDLVLACSQLFPSFQAAAVLLLCGCALEPCSHAAATTIVAEFVSRSSATLSRVIAHVIPFLSASGVDKRHTKRRRLSFDGSQHPHGRPTQSTKPAASRRFVFMTQKELVASSQSLNHEVSVRCVAALVLQGLNIDEGLMLPEAGALQPLLPLEATQEGLVRWSSMALHVILPLVAMTPSPPVRGQTPTGMLSSAGWRQVWGCLVSTATMSITDRVESLLRLASAGSSAATLRSLTLTVVSMSRLLMEAPPARVLLLFPGVGKLMERFRSLAAYPDTHQPLARVRSRGHEVGVATSSVFAAQHGEILDDALTLGRVVRHGPYNQHDAWILDSSVARSLAERVLMLAAAVLSSPSVKPRACARDDIQEAVVHARSGRSLPRGEQPLSLFLVFRVLLLGMRHGNPRTSAAAVTMFPVALESYLLGETARSALESGDGAAMSAVSIWQMCSPILTSLVACRSVQVRRALGIASGRLSCVASALPHAPEPASGGPSSLGSSPARTPSAALSSASAPLSHSDQGSGPPHDGSVPCPRCTFVNPASARKCSVCSSRLPRHRHRATTTTGASGRRQRSKRSRTDGERASPAAPSDKYDTPRHGGAGARSRSGDRGAGVRVEPAKSSSSCTGLEDGRPVVRCVPRTSCPCWDLDRHAMRSTGVSSASTSTPGQSGLLLWGELSQLADASQPPSVRRAYVAGAFSAIRHCAFTQSHREGLVVGRVLSWCADEDHVVAASCCSAVGAIAHALRLHPSALPRVLDVFSQLTGTPPLDTTAAASGPKRGRRKPRAKRDATATQSPHPPGSWLTLQPLVQILCRQLGFDSVDTEDESGWEEDIAERYVGALSALAQAVVPREDLLQVSNDAGVDADKGARILLGDIVVKLVMLWMEAKSTELGAAVFEALDAIAQCWRTRCPSECGSNPNNRIGDLFEALRGQVYPAVIALLLSHERPELLNDFLQELLRGEVSEKTLLRSILPDVLPVLFLERRMVELASLATILSPRRSGGDMKRGEDEEGVLLRPSASVASAACGFSDAERVQVVRLVRPKLHFVVGRLLMQHGRSMEDQLSCWNLLLALFGPSPAQMLTKCWYDLLVWLAVELGKYPSGKRGNPVFVALTMISKLMRDHRLMGATAPASQAGHRDAGRDPTSKRGARDGYDARHVVAMSQAVNSQIKEFDGADDDVDMGKVEDTEDDAPLRVLVHKYFLFITNKLNGILNNGKSTHQDCVIALTSLQRLIAILKHHVGQFIPIVMATLQSPLQDPALALPACRVYLVFVQSLSLDSLEANLNTVTVPMLPIINSGTSTPAVHGLEESQDYVERASDSRFDTETLRVAQAVLSYITQDHHQAGMQAALANLSFLSGISIPGVPGLHIDRGGEGGAGHEDSHDQVRRHMAVLVTLTDDHDSFAVKIMGLRELKTLFVTRRAQVRQLISRGDSCAREVVAALELLLKLSCSSNDELRTICAECLGELGAIDPARVSSIGGVARTRDAVRVYDAMDLAVLLIRQHLVKGLRASNHTMVQDRFAYAIQEMLRVMDAVLNETSEELQLRVKDLVNVANVPGVARIHRRGRRRGVKRRSGDKSSSAASASASVRASASTKRGSGRGEFPQALKDKFLEVAGDDDAEDGLATKKRQEEAEAALEIIMPYWTTSFYANVTKPIELNPPFYDTFRARQKEEEHLDMFDWWLANWTRYLIFCAGGPQWVIFFACRGVLKFDVEIAATLLPYLVQDVLTYRFQEGKAPSVAVCKLRDEILAVLRDQWVPDAHPVASDQNRGASKRASRRTGGVGAGSYSRRTTNAMQHKSTQAVFSLLDILTQWNKATRSSAHAQRSRHHSGSGHGGAEVDHSDMGRRGFAWLMQQIPPGLLAEAAARCRAHARSVLYVENDLRKKYGDHDSVVLRIVPTRQDLARENFGAFHGIGGVYFERVPFTRDDLAHLQLVYSKTMESDGLRGIATLRASLPRDADVDAARQSLAISARQGGAASAGADATSATHSGVLAFRSAVALREQLIDHEQNANWNEALMCYEQALHSLGSEQRWFNAVQESAGGDTGSNMAAEERSLHAGVLRCLLNVGHLETALHRSMGILSTRPELTATVTPFAVEAAWRLDRWSALEELMCLNMDPAGVHPSGSTASALASLVLHQSPTLPSAAAARLRWSGGHMPRASAGTATPTKDYELLLGAALLALQSMVCDAVGPGVATSVHATPMISQSSAQRHARQAHQAAFRSFVNAARRDVVGSLAAATMESYHRAYPYLLRLHALQELERAAALVSCPPPKRRALFDSWGWDDRMAMTMPSFRLREPVFALRRCILSIFGMRKEEGDVWLRTAQAARRDHHYHTATNALLHASRLGCNAAEFETAEILHDQGHVDRALLMLEAIEMDVHAVRMRIPRMDEAEKRLAATRILLATNWMQESGQKQGDEVIARYEVVTQLQPQGARGWFHLGKYLDFLHKTQVQQATLRQAQLANKSASPEQQQQAAVLVLRAELKYIGDIVHCYSQSLLHGARYLFQSLPRLLTLWFDFCAKARKRQFAGVPEVGTVVENLNVEIVHLTERLPEYYWMTALPQLVSRIAHTDPDVVKRLSSILARVLSRYPKQAMWTVVGLTKSQLSRRSKPAQRVCDQVCRDNKAAARIIRVGQALFADLIAVARMETNCRVVRLKIRCSREIRTGSPLLLPLQSALTATLPDDDSDTLPEDYKPFTPTERTYISRFADRARVISSKEKPKKIDIYSQANVPHTFLCKAEKKGDLRKDARLMEFNSMVNRLLCAESETRRRKLRLRTYAVVCLNEECGLLEWVEHTTGFRPLITDVYLSEGLQTPIVLTKKLRHDIESIQSRFAKNPKARVHFYRRKVLPHFPALFHRWFLHHYPDPTKWFESRLAFARSAAVWSMVGHIVGLGDRHGENILIDTMSGECVHVDFECLFDKGLMLQRPEIVPFRLSPNMLDAFGVTGFEGVFRHVAEATMSVLRGNRDALISVLESFVHDPLVGWGSKRRKHRRDGGRQADEPENEHARSMIDRIDERLKGFYNVYVDESRRRHDSYPQPGHAKTVETPPLSIRGQVHRLIKEATSDENASAMYIGWMPFL